MKKIWVESAFYRVRSTFPVDMIIIHHLGSTNGKLFNLNGSITWLTDKNAHLNKQTGKLENIVSAHYIVPRSPYKEHDVIHMVRDENISFHAGTSQWVVDGKPRSNLNNFSIGIELEGDGNLMEYTDFQYDTLTELTKELMAKFGIPESNIVGHEDVSPGRKIDPGVMFDWKRYRLGFSKVMAPVCEVLPSVEPAEKEEAIPTDPEPLPVFMESGEDLPPRKAPVSMPHFLGWLAKLLRIR